MFGIDWNNPQTMWLNYTNLALGVVTLICFVAVGYNIVRELLDQRQKHKAMDRELKDMLAAQGHAMEVPGLGWTMADGGEPVHPPVFKRPPTPREKKQ